MLLPQIQRIALLLSTHQHRLALAESCTGGRLAAELTSIPGASEFFCGSLVVYRDDSKAKWLNIPQSLLDDPNISSVSPQVSLALAQHTLQNTPEATLALAITGHLGPLAPPNQLGSLHIAILWRSAHPNPPLPTTQSLHIPPTFQIDSNPNSPILYRLAMQSSASRLALEFLLSSIEQHLNISPNS
jgi:PncC family amidohydrolase